MSSSTTEDKYTTKQGKRQLEDKCGEKKRRNQKMIEYAVKHVTDGMAQRIKACGEWLAMIANITMEKKRLVSGNFCKNRFCPMCAWRQAKKDALKIAILMEYIELAHKKEFLFLTLTAPNVKADKLKEEIQRYNRNFKKLMERQEVERVVKGYVRKLEITYNAERNDFHPHFHVLIVVDKSYFTGNRQYIKHDKWLELWRDVMEDQSITQVDVRKVRKREGKEVAEIAKYAAKDEDYLVSQEVFDVFYRVLKGRQVVTYSGLFAEAHKLFKEKYLDYLKERDLTEYVYWLLYRWGKGQYVEAEKRELTEQERKELEGHLLREVELEDE